MIQRKLKRTRKRASGVAPSQPSARCLRYIAEQARLRELDGRLWQFRDGLSMPWLNPPAASVETAINAGFEVREVEPGTVGLSIGEATR